MLAFTNKKFPTIKKDIEGLFGTGYMKLNIFSCITLFQFLLFWKVVHSTIVIN